MNPTLRDKLGTFGVVTVITLLIWLWAEGENVDEFKVYVPVRFVPPAETGVEVEPQSELSFVTFRGSAAQAEAIEELKQMGPVQVRVGEGETDIVMRDVLASSDVLRRIGAEVLEADPPVRRVSVTRLATDTLPLRVDAGTLELAEAQVRPATVKVTLPEAYADRVRGVQLIADVSGVGIEDLDPTRSHVRTATVRVPPELEDIADRIRIEPDRVEVALQPAMTTTVVQSVQVHLNMSLVRLQEYDVKLMLPGDALTVESFEVRGPRSIIDDIKAGRQKVWLEVRPTREELELAVQSGVPYPFPPDLHPQGLEAVGSITAVPVSVTRRVGPAPPLE